MTELTTLRALAGLPLQPPSLADSTLILDLESPGSE